MPIPFSLFPNNLTPDPTDYAAAVQTYRSVGFEELADRVVEQGTTVNKPDILAVLEGTVKACERYLLEGNRVVLGGLVQLFPRVRGKFDSAGDDFDPSRHRLDVGANPGQRVRSRLRSEGSVEKVTSTKPKPILVEFADVASGDINSTLTPGNIGNVTGERLVFDSQQPDEGLFFIPEGGGAAIKVQSVSQNRPSLQSFLIPSLIPGDYKLQVRSRIEGGAQLRSGELDHVLTVA